MIVKMSLKTITTPEENISFSTSISLVTRVAGGQHRNEQCEKLPHSRSPFFRMAGQA